ncbi:hypothetical protein LTR70_007491 [Exophiala xenobiotica]|uniref:AAA+ ATPase domain-containing protein n=1 Tax=Lithohypha guttulata TaxID=1690604 RepID=A0ABR0KQF6_9EURO|nr:hypothetical protein LTR24_000412 [Lithohypha guttulata]KAK5313721.1 hypothetical protein LTR70_007491 [Exophiala xenobiotica]
MAAPLRNASAAFGLQPLNTIGLLGLPNYILRNFAPSMVAKAAKNPRLAKTVRLFTSAVAAMVALLRIRGETLSSAKRSQRILRCGNKTDRNICYTEAEGTQYFWHGWRLFRLDVAEYKGHYFSKWDYAISTFGFSNQPVKDLLDETWKAYIKGHASKHTYIWNVQDGNWAWLANRPIRPLDTIDLDDSVKETLVKDLQNYMLPDAEARYISHGIPYRRGYLLHGPPGTGKTSLSLAIAGHFDIDLYVMSLADPGLTDAKLAQLFGSLAKPSVLLLQDIDSAGLEREVVGTPQLLHDRREGGPENSEYKGDVKEFPTNGKPKMTRITLSGLLNALDGVAAPDGCIRIMTTNYPENLDPALTRPGRVGYKLAFQYISEGTARKMFMRLYSEVEGHDLEELSHKFATKLPNRLVSPAELQGYLLEHMGLPELAVSELESWVEKILKERWAKLDDAFKENVAKLVDGADKVPSNDESPSLDSTANQNPSSLRWLKMQVVGAYNALTTSAGDVPR